MGIKIYVGPYVNGPRKQTRPKKNLRFLLRAGSQNPLSFLVPFAPALEGLQHWFLFSLQVVTLFSIVASVLLALKGVGRVETIFLGANSAGCIVPFNNGERLSLAGFPNGR